MSKYAALPAGAGELAAAWQRLGAGGHYPLRLRSNLASNSSLERVKTACFEDALFKFRSAVASGYWYVCSSGQFAARFK